MSSPFASGMKHTPYMYSTQPSPSQRSRGLPLQPFSLAYCTSVLYSTLAALLNLGQIRRQIGCFVCPGFFRYGIYGMDKHTSLSYVSYVNCTTSWLIHL